MPIITPTKEQIKQQYQTDFVSNIPESDPFLQQAWLLALIIGVSNRDFDVYIQLQTAIKDLFPHTAQGIFARQWGNLKGLDKKAASSAEGYISVTGVKNTIIPDGTQWSSTAGLKYESIDGDKTIAEIKLGIKSIVSIESTKAEVTTNTNNHQLATGMKVKIADTGDSIYNQTDAEITVTAENKFQYVITESRPDVFTGTVEVDYVSIKVQALDTGIITNQDAGAPLSLVIAIIDVDSPAHVQFAGLGNGADEETDPEYRERYLEAYRNPAAQYNPANIIQTIKQLPGVTRVFVFPNTPAVGSNRVFFMIDNRINNPIPLLSEVEKARDFVEEKILPVNTPMYRGIGDEKGCIIKAPTAKAAKFTFNFIDPNTQSMRNAITDNLLRYFKSNTVVGEGIARDRYNGLIYQTYDPVENLFLTDFGLSSPTGDLSVNSDEILTLQKDDIIFAPL